MPPSQQHLEQPVCVIINVKMRFSASLLFRMSICWVLLLYTFLMMVRWIWCQRPYLTVLVKLYVNPCSRYFFSLKPLLGFPIQNIIFFRHFELEPWVGCSHNNHVLMSCLKQPVNWWIVTQERRNSSRLWWQIFFGDCASVRMGWSFNIN